MLIKVKIGREGEKKAGKKYRNSRVVFNGVTFDSIKERDRYIVLLERLARGVISGLSVHHPIKALYNGEELFTYEADFVYFSNGVQVVEDVKSEATESLALFRLKKKILRIVNGIDIQVIKVVAQ